MSVFVNGKHLLEDGDLNSLPLNQTDLLTDSQKNLANWNFSPAAKKAIINLNYINGINSFHYKGVADYERLELKISGLIPNTKYKISYVFQSTNKMTALDPKGNPYIPVLVNSFSTITANPVTGNIGTSHIPLAFQGNYSSSISFNTGDHSELYFSINLGLTEDNRPTDIKFGVKLVEMALTKSDIEHTLKDLQNRISKLGG